MNSIELYAELITINDEEDITDDDVELIIDNCIISNNDQQLNMKVNIKESIKKISKAVPNTNNTNPFLNFSFLYITIKIW